MTLQSTTAPRIEYLRSAHLPEVELLLSDHDTTAWHVFHERYVLCAADRASASLRCRASIPYLGREKPGWRPECLRGKAAQMRPDRGWLGAIHPTICRACGCRDRRLRNL
jgi:hypothetical protein